MNKIELNTLVQKLMRKDDLDTSRMAAHRIAGAITKIQATVLAEFKKAGDFGLTDDELETRLGGYTSTLRSRRHELVVKGLLVNSDRKRRASTNNTARIVWILNKEV